MSARGEFLFEVGFEEMPAPWLEGLAQQLKAKFEAIAADQALDAKEARAFWTSRRLVLVADVKARQDDRNVVEWGPAAKIAKDAGGAWTKAAEGFAKKQGLSMDALSLQPKVEGAQDLYLCARKSVAGRDARDVLAESIAPLLRSLNFPKRMNWDAWLDDGKGAFQFGRPIRWIVTLFAGDLLPFSIFELKGGAKGDVIVTAGRRSSGHRFYPRSASSREFDVSSFADLSRGLDDRYVVLDPQTRASRIAAQIESAGGSKESATLPLAHEWRDLVEFPHLAIGVVPREFADLPEVVIETVLAHHQKAIVLPKCDDGASSFAVITGGDPKAAENAARGQERVVSARLKDARFFLKEDSKRVLSDCVADLDGVTFHKVLGTYGQKAKRVEALCGLLASRAGVDEASARRAGLLCKADLVTLMVREFTELQGAIGGLYAEKTESAEIADAIRFHYLPVAVERTAAPAGVIASSSIPLFAIVSFADKLDTLIGYFGIGTIPSGSSDPFGLRRAAQGVIRVLLDFWPGDAPDLRDLILRRYAIHDVKLSKSADECAKTVIAFLGERLRHVLVTRGAAADEVDAVLHASRDPLADVRDTERRVEALGAVRSEAKDVFASLSEAFKRAKNIAGETASIDLDPQALTHDSERALHLTLQTAEKTEVTDPRSRLRAAASLKEPLDAFFKNVMVMSEDPRERANRLALLKRVLNLVYEIADLSRLA